MIIKYELKEATLEVDCKRKLAHEVYHKGITLESNWIWDSVKKSFDTLDDAMRALNDYRCSYREFRASNGHRYIDVTEYYVECNQYDNEGGWVQCDGIYEYAALDENLALDASAELFDDEEYIDEQDEEMEL